MHEECLTGLAAWQATVYPAPLAWGATFDPELVERMGARDRRAPCAALGVHQGLAPVLDVVRDLRWGRVEETIGEDPYLVGTIGSRVRARAESAGVIATLKHFAGYSASRAGRNLAPVSIGPRELADVLLPPFEMALRAGARSVMNAYTDIDGVPAAADPALLTDLLRDAWGFTGTVVADYFSVAFLQTLHGVAGDRGDAAAAGAGGRHRRRAADGRLLRRAAARRPSRRARSTRRWSTGRCARVLRAEVRAGPAGRGLGARARTARAAVDLDPADARALARELAERVGRAARATTATLPLRRGAADRASSGRGADDAARRCWAATPSRCTSACTTPTCRSGVEIPTAASRRCARPATTTSRYAQGCPVLGGDDEGIAAAVARRRRRPTSASRCSATGPGCSAAARPARAATSPTCGCPGAQEELLEAVLATGTPVVLVLLVGRPYDAAPAGRPARRRGRAAFFPGEEGGPALAGVLSGRGRPVGPAAGELPRRRRQPAVDLPRRAARRSAARSAPSTRRRCSRSATGCPTRTLDVGGATRRRGRTWPTDGDRRACAVTVRNDRRPRRHRGRAGLPARPGRPRWPGRCSS